MTLHGRNNLVFALLVFFVSFVVYLLTAPPTVALWDCGEFLAAGACLGIPHPPGTPLLVMIGRLYLLGLGFLQDPGFRMNLLAVSGAALTVVFIYLIVVRALRLVIGEPDTAWKRRTLYCGGVVGALFCAFGNTFWFCSLEGSQQSNFQLIPVAASTWLALKWLQSKSPHRDRLLLLIAFIGFAGVGLHMSTLLILPAIFLFVMVADPAKRSDWRLWGTGLGMALVLYNASWFVFVGPALVVITLVMALLRGPHQGRWRFCFWFAALAVLGFSNHLYLPIRASLDPAINENDPDTWKAFRETLDRRQYGEESMVARSFWRRGALSRQFGIEGHMGYGGFHLTQFFHFSPRDREVNFVTGPLGFLQLLVYLIPTGLMLLGWYCLFRKNRPAAVLLVSATLLTTLIMAWFMNFADGTRPEYAEYQAWVQGGRQGEVPLVHREVRVRDYFFNDGFMFFGMWIGIAAGCLLWSLFTHRDRRVSGTLAPLLLVLFALSPALPLVQNYAARDRSMNWLPFDFAWNLLMSCERNGIIFTNGDNDTFPVWALQQAYGIRQDVRLVNLSLLNTDWYIKQLKHQEPRVPISFPDNRIDSLQPEINPFGAPTPYTLPQAGIQITLPGREQHFVLRVQDAMVLNIVETNRWQKPIYFSTTVSQDNLMGLEPFLQMQALVFRLRTAPLPDSLEVDVPTTVRLLDSLYRYRTAKISDDPVDAAAKGLMTNYSSAYIRLALSFNPWLAETRARIDTLSATAPASPRLDELKQVFSERLEFVLAELDKAAELVPWDWRLSRLRQEMARTYSLAGSGAGNP